MHAGVAFVLAHEDFKARLDALARGETTHVVHVDIGTFRFRHGELAELEEAVARRGRQEIRVAAARIEHQTVALLGRLDQRILQFEWAQQGEFAWVTEIHFCYSFRQTMCRVLANTCRLRRRPR
ncbi:hypothetical protein D3C72_1787180 [compost metagenome]